MFDQLEEFIRHIVWFHSVTMVDRNRRSHQSSGLKQVNNVKEVKHGTDMALVWP